VAELAEAGYRACRSRLLSLSKQVAEPVEAGSSNSCGGAIVIGFFMICF